MKGLHITEGLFFSEGQQEEGGAVDLGERRGG